MINGIILHKLVRVGRRSSEGGILRLSPSLLGGGEENLGRLSCLSYSCPFCKSLMYSCCKQEVIYRSQIYG
jgi:hypothetical protein